VTGKMTAAVLYGKEDIKIERVPIPRVGEGEVLVKVHVALTCGTDLKVYQRGYHARMIVPPALFGHELAGTVEEVGEGVRGFKKGSEMARQVTTVAGATSVNIHCQFTDKDGKPLVDRDITGKVWFMGGNLRATFDFAKKAASVAHENFAPIAGS